MAFTKKQIKQTLQTVVFFLIGVLLVYFQINQLSVEEKSNVVNSIKQANFFWIGIAMVIALLSHLVRAARWRQLINSTDDKVSLPNAFYAVMIGYLANGFLPRFGEVIRCGVLGRKENIKFEKLIGTVVAERIFDLIVMIVVVGLTIAIQYDFLYDFLNRELFHPFSLYFKENSTSFFITLAIVIAVLFGLYFLLGKVLEQFSNKLATKWESVRDSFAEGFSTILNLKNKALFVFYSISMWVCYFFMSFFVFSSLTETKHLGVDAGLSVLTSGSLALLIPTPGGLGSYHQFVSKTLQLYDVSETIGVSLSWLIWSTNFSIILVVGLLSLLIISYKRSK